MGAATIRVCDFGDEEHAADIVATAEAGDVRYSLDVCEAHEPELHQALTGIGFTPTCVRVGHNLREGFVSAQGQPFTVKQARSWLRENGYQVSDRGKIPSQYLELYAQEH